MDFTLEEMEWLFNGGSITLSDFERHYKKNNKFVYIGITNKIMKFITTTKWNGCFKLDDGTMVDENNNEIMYFTKSDDEWNDW
jgi:hypothetical protein